MLLQEFHIMYETIYLMKCPSPSCSKPTTQHDVATPALPCWDGGLRFPTSPRFPLNVTVVMMAKHFKFSFIRRQDFLQRLTSLSLCAFARTLSYQVKLASSQCLLLLFWD
ncbi:hypothetical protein CHARACLAT_017228 [Characodon lateralis]|uniref:Uncharacterized protein n=1 Tax=Characodon lateralis TaxID=208331 RepID=A0ABU7EUX7_9TELE|nr:hypothetical protein [Characodon lateralis]